MSLTYSASGPSHPPYSPSAIQSCSCISLEMSLTYSASGPSHPPYSPSAIQSCSCISLAHVSESNPNTGQHNFVSTHFQAVVLLVLVYQRLQLECQVHKVL